MGSNPQSENRGSTELAKVNPKPPASFTWFASGLAAAIAIGWIAAALNFGHAAPVGLYSLAIGATLGGVLGTLAARMHIDDRRRLLFTAATLTIVTVLAEHAFLYLRFRQQWHEARAANAQIAMFRPESPWSPSEYLAREIGAGSLPFWFLDAALIAVAASTTLFLVVRLLKTDPKSDTRPPTSDL